MEQEYQKSATLQLVTATLIQRTTISEVVPQQHHDCAVLTQKAPRRPSYLFPKPEDEKGSVICESERIIKIYNKQNNESRAKLTSTIERWFIDEAIKQGWARATFYPCCR